MKKYRDRLKIIDEILSALYLTDSLNISRIGTITNTSYRDMKVYIKQLLLAGMIKENIIQPDYHKEYLGYQITNKGRSLLPYLRDLNK